MNIKRSSLCGLGQTASNPVLATLKYYRDEYVAHIEEKKCPAGECKAMTKVMIINGSPRKNFNTAKLLKEATRGAQETGAEVETVNLYDLNYKGCISCLMCKRKGVEQQGLCFYKDNLHDAFATQWRQGFCIGVLCAHRRQHEIFVD